MVGNTGSAFKPHYGPLGHAVNLASRVEGATKKLGVPVLITGATHAGLAGAFATRRLCRVRVLGINEPVDLYELHGESADDDWRRMCAAYESGLALFESGQSGEACRTIYPILSSRDGNYDKPSLTLVSRAIEHLNSPDDPFDAVWNLQTK